MSDIDKRQMSRSDDPSKRPARVRVLEREGMSTCDAWCEVYGFDTEDLDERESTSDQHRIRISGELFHVSDTRIIGYGDLVEIETDEGESFILSESEETAGAAARERWEDMANNDPTEFACIVGEKTLVAWALGQPAGPGSAFVTSLKAWLDVVATVPNEEWAGYDHEERDIDRVGKLVSELGFTPGVAYRSH